MPQSLQSKFRARATKVPHLEIRTFDNQIEHLMAKASGVVAMGGYNTFCEILSFDKRAVIVPRETPRMEQRIRADFAAASGLSRLLPCALAEDTGEMHAALCALPGQPKPSQAGLGKLLGGLDNINTRLERILAGP